MKSLIEISYKWLKIHEMEWILYSKKTDLGSTKWDTLPESKCKLYAIFIAIFCNKKINIFSNKSLYPDKNGVFDKKVITA